MDDIKPPQQLHKPQPLAQERELIEPVTPVESIEFDTPAVVQPKRKKRRVPVILIIALVTILFGILCAALYAKWTEADDAKSQLSSAQSKLTAAQAAAKKAEETENTATTASKAEDFSAFIAEYDKMSAAAVSVTDDDKKAIEAAIKDHHKPATLPVGWTIVIAYKDAKADTTTGKPVNALVYWPAIEQKPASFFEVTQTADGKWAYNAQQ